MLQYCRGDKVVGHVLCDDSEEVTDETLMASARAHVVDLWDEVIRISKSGEIIDAWDRKDIQGGEV
jgi:hypothetical protein